MLSKLGVAAVAGGAAFVMAALARGWKGDLEPSLLWLGTATVTAIALTVGPPRSWWAIAGGFVGAVIAGPVLFDDTFPSLLGPVFGNTAETIILTLAIPLVLGRDVTIRTTGHGLAVLVLVLLATATGGLIALTGTASTVIGDDAFESWWRWVLGNSVGQLLLLPVVLFRNTAVITKHSEQRPVELVVTLALMTVVGSAAITAGSFLVYLVVPLILWIAIRFGPLVAAPVAVVAAVSIAAATARGHGPFVEFDGDPQRQVHLFQLSLAACVLIGGAHAVRAWNDRNHLVAVLSAIPDVLFVRRRADDQIVSSWIPTGSKESAVGLDPLGAVTPAIETTPLTPSDPAIVVTDDAGVFERRTVAIDEERDLDLFRDVTIEREALRQLQSRRDAIEAARRDEQIRLGRTLHDSPIQLLSAALLRLETAMEDPGGSREDVARAEELTRQAVTELRDGIDRLTEPRADDRNVVDVLGSLARQLLDADVEIDLRSTGSPLEREELEQTLLLVGREAVSNAALHADASRLTIGVEEREGAVILTVADNGRGVADPAPLRRGLGLSLMRERVSEQGGEIRIEPGPDGGGTVVTITLPSER